MDTKSRNVDKWVDHQKKYEESQEIISKQLIAIDELNKKITDLKDVYN